MTSSAVARHLVS